MSVFVIRSVLVVGTLAVHGNASSGIVCVGLQASLAIFVDWQGVAHIAPKAQGMSEVLKHMEYEAKHKVKLKLLYLLKNKNIVSLAH